MLAVGPSLAGVGWSQGCEPTLIQVLHGADTPVDNGFGAEVAMSGSTLAVLDSSDHGVAGPFGSVSLYQRADDSAGGWELEDIVHVDGGFPGWMINANIALESTTLVVGIQSDGELGGVAGAAFVYERDRSGSGDWNFVQKLLAPDGNRADSFGDSLALSGDWLLIGASRHPGLGRLRGAVYAFRRNEGGPNPWAFWQKLEPTSLDFFDLFGSAIVVDRTRLLVSAENSDLATFGGGSLFEFQWDGRVWIESQHFTAPGLDVDDGLGAGLALSGEWLFAGAVGDDDLGPGAGAVHVFRHTDGRWQHHQKLLPETGTIGDTFGGPLVAEDDRLYVGDPFVSEKGASAGTVYTFQLEPVSEQWIQVSRFFPPDLDEKDFLGTGLAVQDGIVAAGATKSLEPGAVYLFSARPGRDVVTYCTASSGIVPDCAPALESIGAPSASQSSTFRIFSRRVPGGHSGILLYTEGGPARTDLVRSGVCLPGGPSFRKGYVWSGGDFGMCNGSFSLDWNEFIDDRNPEDSLLRTAGAVVHIQIGWFEPIAPGPVAWSDAVAFQICP